MEAKASLPYLQESATGRYAELSTTAHPISLRSILILSSYLYLSVLSGLFPSGFTTKILYANLICPMHATCPTHLVLLDLIILIIFGEVCKL
jgi:hypothetical protein